MKTPIPHAKGEIVKQKTAELEDKLLDAAVTLALGVKANLRDGRADCYLIPFDTGPSESRDGDIFEPSTRWDHGGPIIERERLSLTWRPANDLIAVPYWAAKGPDVHPELYGSLFWSVGPTPLIAAMRAYVASKLGNEVDLP
jgi:hypothetical protein